MPSFRKNIRPEHLDKIKFENHAESPFFTLTNPSDLLQMAIVRSVDVLCIRVFMKFSSDTFDCMPEMMGIDLYVRKVLLVFTRDIWRLSSRRTQRGIEEK